MSCAIIWSLLMVLGAPLLGKTFNFIICLFRRVNLGHVSAGLWLVVEALKSDSDIMGLACFSNSLLWLIVFIFQCIVLREVKKVTLITELNNEENHYKQGS